MTGMTGVARMTRDTYNDYWGDCDKYNDWDD